MRKIYFFLMILLIGFCSMHLSAQETPSVLTVANGTSTNGFVPVYGLYLDEAQHNQIIYPESMLGDMVTGEISEMKFYLQNNVTTTLTSTITVSLGTTTTETFTSGILTGETLTQVYTGSIDISNQEFTLTFSTPFTYNGGNLLFDITTTAANWTTTTFLGISSTGSSYAYNNIRNFIPKTTFTYTGGALCKTPYGVIASDITTTDATISWHGDENASSYNIQYMLSSSTDWSTAETTTSSDTTVYLTGLQPSSTYKVRVQVECIDNTQTVWSAVHSFMTACDIIPFTDSWIEDFESTYQGSNVQRPLLCWAVPVQDPTTNGPFVYCGYGEACHSGVNSMEMKGFSGAMNIAVLPEFSADIHDLRLTFWATSTNPQYGTLEVGVMTDASDTSTFELVGVCSTPGSRGGSSAGNGNLMGPFDFDMVQATSGRIALRFTSNYSGSYGLSWNLDDFTVSLIPQCAEPGNLITGNVTSSSADISWNESPSNTYEVLYWTTDPTNPDIITNATLTDGVLTLTGLNPNTSYNWTVRTDCGDGTYANAFQTLSFTTPNVPVELPYEQDFETDPELITDFTIQGSGPNQWFIGAATFKPIDASDSTETGHSLYISNDNGVSNSYTNTSTSYAYAILDLEFDDTPMEYHLSFDYKLEGEGTSTKYDYLSVYLMDGSATVPTNATPSGTALLYQSNAISDWTHKDYILENVANSTKKIVFYWKNDNSQGTNPPAAIDNISILGFTCAQPTQLAVTDIASDNVTIDWTEVGSSTSWAVSYGPTGYTLGNDENEIIETVYDHPYIITGLTPTITYDIYVQSDCGSNWSGPLTVTPGSFNMAANGSDTLTTCNLLIYDNGGATGSYTSNCNGTLVLYPADPDSKMGLTGTCTTESGYDYLYVYDGVGTEGSYLARYHGSNQLVNVLSTTGPLTIKFTSDNSTNSAGFELLAQCISCFPPTNLSATDVDMTEATISWSGIAAEYGIYVILTDTTYYTTTDSFITLTNLMPSSTYRVLVRSLCGTDSSAFSQVFSFNTSCGQITIDESTPWFEDFEGYGNSGGAVSIGTCWATPETYTVSNGTAPFVYLGYSGSAYSGENTLEMKGSPIMVVLPEFSNDINTLRFSMWGNTTAGDATDAGTMALGYISDINDPTTFIAIDTIPATAFNRTGTDAPHANFIGPYDFSGVTPQTGLRIALRLTDIGTLSWSNDPHSWNLDDITVSLIPGCPSPVKTSVTATNVDGHNATISWTDHDVSHDSWTVFYRAQGEANWESTIAGPTPSVDLNNLDPETSYEAYVITNCTTPDPVADATNTITFQTLVACPAPQNVTVSDIDMSSATVTWTGSADSYTIVCGDFTSTETGNTAIITGLSSATAYTLTITADCGSEDGTSSPATVTFMTACETITDFPYIEGFENGLGCWVSTPTVGTINWAVNSNYNYSSSLPEGNSCVVAYTSSHGPETELTSPIFDLTSMTNPYLSFHHIQTVWAGDQDELYVYYKNTLSATPVLLISFTGDISSWQMDSVALPNPSSQYQIIFKAVLDYGHGVGLDKVIIYDNDGSTPPTPPTCDAPTALSYSNVTINSATISWTAGGSETSWNIQYKLQSANPWQEATVNTTSYNMTDLTANNTYEVRVKAICSEDNQSDFVYTSFTTQAVGIDNIVLANSISLMPNPADSYLELHINSNVVMGEAVVYNAFGQMIQKVELTDKHVRINLSDMAAGMYFVRVNGNGVSATKKFIKR